MKNGFKNILDPKEKKNPKSPWDFTAPPYDERTSIFVDAGCHYGVGHRQPVGHQDNPKERADTLPFGRHPQNLEEIG